MKAKPECDRCFLRQARHAAGLAGLSPEATDDLVSAVGRELGRLPVDVPPPVRASRVHGLVRELSANPDPYRAAKRAATAHALSLYPRLRQRVESAADPFETAVRLAIAGNIIDLGAADGYDLEASVERVLEEPLAIDHLERLRRGLGRAREVLYLGDNAGETVFDRLLIERLGCRVTYVVKGAPAVNDATRDDAAAAGLDGLCEVIDTGESMLGILPERCPPELMARLARAELVIAKGMANFESLSGSRRGLFFLLQAKCAVVAGHLGVPDHGLVVMEDGPDCL
jgi:uncharacterized protein with ATP-grasp and redox domains